MSQFRGSRRLMMRKLAALAAKQANRSRDTSTPEEQTLRQRLDREAERGVAPSSPQLVKRA